MPAEVCAIATCALIMLADHADAQPDLSAPGVPLELAIARAARYGEIRYGVDVTLAAPFERVQGRLQLRFDTQVVDSDLILDWRPQQGGRLSQIEVNGAPYDAPRVEREHLIVPGALLKRGANRIDLVFEAPIAGAGTALTRFHDPADQ